MKKFFKLSGNLIFILGLSLVLISCTTTENIVPPDESRDPTTVTSTDSSTVPPSDTSTTPTLVSVIPLDVKIDFSNENCSCTGDFKTTKIILSIGNGDPPFTINGQTPVNERLVTFPVTPGIAFQLTITSYDNRVYEANIEVPRPSSCKAPKSCNGETDSSGSSGNGTSCHNENVCHNVEIKKTVCVDWLGNSGKCRTWEDQVTLEQVCSVEEVCQ